MTVFPRTIEPAVAAPAVRMQRVEAEGALTARVVDGRTRIGRLRQEGAAKIRFPNAAGDPLEAVLINTAGGLTGGDRVAWQVEAGAGAGVVATTQACEKIYRASDGHAAVSARLTVGPGGRIAWLPQETILFEQSALHRRLDIDLADDSSLLVCEATIFGRTARGEHPVQAVFRDRWRVRVGGRLVHAEDFAIGPALADALGRSAVSSGSAAMASVLMIDADPERLLDPLRDALGDRGGASFWTVAGTGKLLARLVAEDGYTLRQRLVPVLELLNGRAGLPKVWSI